MDEIDALMDALWSAARGGDEEAAAFLLVFVPWAVEQTRGPEAPGLQICPAV